MAVQENEIRTATAEKKSKIFNDDRAVQPAGKPSKTKRKISV